MDCFAGSRLFVTCAAALCFVLIASAAVAQQGQVGSATVVTPSGPVSGPLDVATALQRFPLTESAKGAKELIALWTFPKKMVVIVDTPSRAAWLQEAMPSGVTVVGVRNDAAAQRELPDAYAFILANGDCGLVHGQGSPDMFKNDPHLEWVHSASGGTDQCLISPQLANGSILLTNSQKVKSNGLAENAYGFIFALARNMDFASANTRAGAFGTIRPTRPPKSLSGATMLVVGLGGSGTEVARIGHELGMTVIATRASGHDGPPFVEYVGLSDELPNLIGRADIVVVAAPLTPETRGMFNSAMFSRMKRGAMFVDFTRAEIVVPEDLAAALQDGRVGSAGMDWASDNPLPADSPLWKAPNLILTGSRAGSAEGSPPVPAPPRGVRPAANPTEQRDEELRWILVRENMRRFAAGEKMFSVFDVKRGY